MADNYQGFTGKLNEIVQDYFANFQTYYDATGFNADYSDKYNHIFANLIKTKGPDMIKASNIENYLSEWERPGGYGGFVRSLAVNPALPIDPPSFADGTIPNNSGIFKSDVDVTYHPLRIISEFPATTWTSALIDSFNNEGELTSLITGILNSIATGCNSTMYRTYKELIYKFYNAIPTATRTALTDTTIPATITSEADAKTAVAAIRNWSSLMLYDRRDLNVRGFEHLVVPERQRLYITYSLANQIVDNLKLANFTFTPDYANIAGNLSQYLGIPVRMLDDLGGKLPYDASDNALFPIFNANGAVTGTFAATKGGTTAVPVAKWVADPTYKVRALLTEDDFGNVFIQVDRLNTQFYPRGGGYTNTFRYTDRIGAVKPQSNTIFFQ
jgi:hypothetical protein